MPCVLMPALALLASGLVACSVLIDRNAKQCSSPGDCERLSPGSGSTCNVEGVCVASVRLGPVGCSFGPAKAPEDFANICTAALSEVFKNAEHSVEGAHDLKVIPPPDAGAPAPATDAGASGSDAGTPVLPSCADPDDGRGQVIYITGSSNFPPLLAKLGPLIMRDTGYTPVYQITSSCNGVKTAFGSQPKDHLMVDPPSGSRAAPATYVRSDGVLVPCALGPGGVTVDIGESDIYSSSCPTFPATQDGIGDYLGPVQAMVFVVPIGSTQKVISAEMAHVVFGRGGDTGNGDIKAEPWTDSGFYFVRNANTGTQQMIGRAINVDADKFWGGDRGTAANLAYLLPLVAMDKAEQAIGIISSDYYHPEEGKLKELAFQAYGQLAGFWPDSTQYKSDKRNVRDGHYPIWGPLHFFTATASDGTPTSPAARAFTAMVTVPEPGKDLLNAYIEAGLVPSCAMKVQRSADLGPLSPVPAGAIDCTCYFETHRAAGVAPAGCQTCNVADDCSASKPACLNNFCEGS